MPKAKTYRYSMKIYKYSMRIYKYPMKFRVPVMDPSDCSFTYNYDLIVLYDANHHPCGVSNIMGIFYAIELVGVKYSLNIVTDA